MIVGIVGLGLISGSMAKAYAADGHTVLADNRNRAFWSSPCWTAWWTRPWTSTTSAPAI